MTRLANLRLLILNKNKLTALPPEIGNLTNLTTLLLNSNGLTALPPEIVKLTNLTTLSLDNNGLTALPPEIVNLTNLTALSLDNNKLTALPPEIGNLTNLTSLWLNNNGLMWLPSEIGNLTNLTTLSLDNNKLTALPSEIVNLTNLTALLLRNNELTALPRDMAKMTALRLLDLRGNRLPLLPEVLNNINDPAGILTLYFQQQGSATRPLCEAKMLILGQGFAGKTSLVRAIQGLTTDPNQLKTDGIDIQPLRLRIRGEVIKVNVWDFGGQEVMHATHQFFLTQRSLYLLVLNARQSEAENRIEYWLKLIQTFGGGAPVLIAINKSEEHQLDVDEAALRRKYPNIKGFFRTAACPIKQVEPPQGITELLAAIYHEIDGLENLRNPLPEPCFKVKEILESTGRDFISHEEYQEICAANNVPVALQNILLELLNDIGTVQNYRDHKRFDLAETNILNPEWVTKGVYAVLNYLPRVARKAAVLQTDLLPRILPQGHYRPEKYPFLLGIMEEFELCFCLDGEKRSEFLLPDLLPPSEPDTGDWTEKLMFEYRYPIWIPSIMTRFIVRMSRHVSKDTVWRNGVLLRHEGMRALVKVDPEDKQLAIWVEGPTNRRREMLAIIRKEFAAIHDSFEDLQVTQRVPIAAHPGSYVSYEHLLKLEELIDAGKAQDNTHIPEGMSEPINVRELLGRIVAPEERRIDRGKRDEEAAKTPQAVTATANQIQEKTQPTGGLPSFQAFAVILLLAIVVLLAVGAGVARTVPATLVPTVYALGILGVIVIGAFSLYFIGKMTEKGLLEILDGVRKSVQTVFGGKAAKPDKPAAGHSPGPNASAPSTSGASKSKSGGKRAPTKDKPTGAS